MAAAAATNSLRGNGEEPVIHLQGVRARAADLLASDFEPASRIEERQRKAPREASLRACLIFSRVHPARRGEERENFQIKRVKKSPERIH